MSNEPSIDLASNFVRWTEDAMLASGFTIQPDDPKIAALASRIQTTAAAEARDATGLSEALDAHATDYDACFCICGWEAPTASIDPGDAVRTRQWRDHREQAVRAALAAAPPEPRWPSRDELAKAIHVANGWSPGEWNDGAELDQCYEYADAILAALREGAERPSTNTTTTTKEATDGR